MVDAVTIGALNRIIRNNSLAYKVSGGTVDGGTIGASTPVNSIASNQFNYVLEAGTTVSSFSNGKLTTFGSTLAKTFTLSAPVAGVEKYLHMNISSTAIQTVQCDSLSTFGLASSSLTKLVIDPNTAKDAVIDLIGEATNKWVVASLNSTAITITT